VLDSLRGEESPAGCVEKPAERPDCMVEEGGLYASWDVVDHMLPAAGCDVLMSGDVELKPPGV